MVGNLAFDFPGGGARVPGIDLGVLDGELGVFQPADVLQGSQAAGHEQDYKQPGGDLVGDRIFRDIHCDSVLL